jgi:hypothetical protein
MGQGALTATLWLITLVISTILAMGCSGCRSGGTDADDSDGDISDIVTEDRIEVVPDIPVDTVQPDTTLDGEPDTPDDTGYDPTVDPGEWEWVELPAGEDCGVGCRQLTFTDEVKTTQWDVWDGVLAYVDPDYQLYVVDTNDNRYAQMPPLRPELSEPPPPPRASYMYPAVYENRVYSEWTTTLLDPWTTEIAEIDLVANSARSLYLREYDHDYISFSYAIHIDAYESRIIAAGGCGSYEHRELCLFDTESPGEVSVLIAERYGLENSMWGDIVVWTTGTADIQAWDFTREAVIPVTDDTPSQCMARVQDGRVVYQDLSIGGTPCSESWAHAAVFIYDIETEARVRLTNGEWIAAYPDVFGDIVIWADYRNCADPNNKNSFYNVEIWGHDLVSGVDFQITDLPGRAKTTPRIWGDKVYVHMYTTTGGSAIYMFDIPAH